MRTSEYIGLVCLVALGLLFVGSMGDESAWLLRPKVLWKSSFGESINGTSVSGDGDHALVWWNKVVKTDQTSGKQDIKSTLLLIDKTGKRLWSYTADKRIRAATIFPSNKSVMVVFSAGESGEGSDVLLLSKEGKRLSQFFTWGAAPKVSEDGEFILVDDTLELQTLRVYSGTGALLWKGEHSGRAEFVSDNQIAVFDGERIVSYRAEDGSKLWDTTLPGRTFVFASTMSHSREGGCIALSTGDSVDPSIYLLEESTGRLIRKLDYGFVFDLPRWQANVSVSFLRGTKLLIALLTVRGRHPGSLLCFDNETGTLAWQKRVKGEARLYALPDDTHLVVGGTLYGEVSPAGGVRPEPEPYNLYVIDQSGRILSKLDIKGSVTVSNNGQLVITVVDRDSVEFVNAGSVVEKSIRPEVDAHEAQ
jgi:outer membrane protein assembly factor BamB